VTLFSRLCKRIRIRSFDLFDTLIARCLIRPTDLFLEVEQRLIRAGNSIPEFAQRREQAEFGLRKARGFGTEVSLEEVYSALAADVGQDHQWMESAMAAELRAEHDLLFPVPEGLELLQKARKKGTQILFVSDTYLPRSFLEPLLAEFGILKNGDRLYLSVESGLMKSTGELFHHVAQSEGVKPSRILHTGDNRESDFKEAVKAGWKTVLFRPMASNRYENPSVDSDSVPERLAQSFFHGIRRKLRVEHHASTTRDRVIFDSTIGVSAPLLISFTHWCLQQAVARKLTRLYFLSRDGEILLKIARGLNKTYRYPVELRYLFASRQALLLPSLEEPLEKELDWILAPTAVLSPRIVLRRVNLKPEPLEDALEQAGFPLGAWDTHLDDSNRARLAEFLLSPRIREHIHKNARAARLLAETYLEQEGLTHDTAFAIVDIGWRGTLQTCISRLLETMGHDQPVCGLYYGLMGRKRHKPEDELDAFFFDTARPSAVDSIDYLVPVLEMFVAAQHGGVSGYQLENNEVTPSFRSEKNDRALSWGLGVQQEAILALADALSRQPALKIDSNAIHRDTVRNLEQFARNPSRAEARVFGSFLDAEDQNEAIFVPLAKPFRFMELRRHRDEGYLHHHNEWRAGAIALTHRLFRRCLRVENTVDEQHPICDAGVKPVEGFGPVERPNSKYHLPRFMWAYGPRCTLEVEARDDTRTELEFDIRNYHANQRLEFSTGGQILLEVDIPQNFGEKPTEPCRVTVNLGPRHETIRLEIRPLQWARDDRPLAVILSSVRFLRCTAASNG